MINIPLNFPAYSFRIEKNADGKEFIFDRFRNKNIPLTPEEWVRQHLIRYLAEEKNFPVSLISIEAGMKVNRMARRYDALVYNREGKPLMLIECKAPTVAIGQETFDQVNAYNRTTKVPYLLLSNGLKHYCCVLDEVEVKYIFMPQIPDYNKL
jgi:type I site-specific restriction endonuclease